MKKPQRYIRLAFGKQHDLSKVSKQLYNEWNEDEQKYPIEEYIDDWVNRNAHPKRIQNVKAYELLRIWIGSLKRRG